jgi:hypothetical protein
MKHVFSLAIVGLIVATVWGDNSYAERISEKETVKRPHTLPEALSGQWELIGEAINEPGYDIWGSSPVCDEKGRVHLFCARWSGSIAFTRAWRYNSEIAHYVADKPEGPFRFVDVVSKNCVQGWNAVGYHNPSIKKIGNRYVLVFIANDGSPKHGPNQRIGMLVADSLNGPWRAMPDESTPLLSPPEDRAVWCYGSGCGVTNPTLLVHPDGRFLLYFKAMSGPRPQGKVSMGVAVADTLEGPYTIQSQSITANSRTIEDGYAFCWRDHICLMTTDNHGILERGGGLIWTSKDGLHFDDEPLSGFHHFGQVYLRGNVPDNAKAHYGNSVKFERPQLLQGASGEPEYLYCPSGVAVDGSDGTNCYVLRRQR